MIFQLSKKKKRLEDFPLLAIASFSFSPFFHFSCFLLLLFSIFYVESAAATANATEEICGAFSM